MHLNSYGDILTISELAELLVIGKNTAYSLIRSGDIRVFRIGRVYKIPKDAVNEYILSSTVKQHNSAYVCS